ncbi:MAG: TonB-dependent receptor, partial [Myxococcota bacterium]
MPVGADEPEEGEAAQVEPAEEATAQEPQRRFSSAIEEITVTATKREENIQDVPIAISAFSGVDLQRRGIRDVQDLQQVSPSLIVTNSNSESGGGTIRIRGMGTTGNNPGLEAAVGTFIDGVYRSRSGQAFGELLDVERVEILRGPQGTLFGKNTSAGAVHIITAKPEFDFSGHASYSLGDFNYDKGTLGLTGPLVGEKLAYRVAGMFAQREGFYNDLTSSDKFSDQDRWSIKGQLLWTPTDTIDVRAIFDYNDRGESCCPAVFKDPGPTTPAMLAVGGFAGPSDPKSFDVGTNGDPFENVEDQGLSLEINWDLGPDITLTSMTAWRDFDVNRGQDVDFTSADILSLRDEKQLWQNFSSELRLAGVTGPLDWLVGFYTYQERFEFSLETPFGTAGPTYVGLLLEGLSATESSVAEVTGFLFPGDSGGLQVYDQDTEGYSIFSHNTWHITDRLALTAGGRYSIEKKRGKASIGGDVGTEALPLPGGLSNNPAWCNGLVTIDAAGGGVPMRLIIPAICDNGGHFGKQTEREVSGTFKLVYQLAEDVTTYGSYSRGYKAGGFNLDPNARQLIGGVRYQDESQFKPEFADAYELGLKAQLFDRRLTVNSAVFYTQFEDFQ